MPETSPSTDQSEPQRQNSLADVRETYAEQADQMARFRWLNRLVSGRYRRRLFGRADGRVLDVACGTGLNFEFLPETTTYVGIDASPEMLAVARRELGNYERVAGLHEMDAQALDFDDDSFDTVISSLSTCTFPDPIGALDEMSRVCNPDGRVLLLEHGRSSVGAIARFQDWRADAHFEKHSCRWNQDPLSLLEDAALTVEDSSSALFGVITAIEATPRP